MECRTITGVYCFVSGMTRRIYRTARQPTRYYYQVDGNRKYINEDLLTEEQKAIITTKGGHRND